MNYRLKEAAPNSRLEQGVFAGVAIAPASDLIAMPLNLTMS